MKQRGEHTGVWLGLAYVIFKVKFTTSNIGLNYCAHAHRYRQYSTVSQQQSVQCQRSACLASRAESHRSLAQAAQSCSRRRLLPPMRTSALKHALRLASVATGSSPDTICIIRRGHQCALAAVDPRAQGVQLRVGTPYAMPRHIEQVWQPVCHPQQPKPKVRDLPSHVEPARR